MPSCSISGIGNSQRLPAIRKAEAAGEADAIDYPSD